MSEAPGKNSVQKLRQAAISLVGVAIAARIAWEFLAPLVPVLVSFKTKASSGPIT